jgi:hypothetical protein
MTTFLQCCGSGMFIPNPNFFHPGSEFFPSRIRVKEFKPFYLTKWFLSSREYDPRCTSQVRIPDPDPDFLLIPDPGSRGQKPRIRNTDLFKIPLHWCVQETTARETRAAETIAAAPAKNSKSSTTKSPVRTGLQAEGVHSMYTNTSRKEIAPSGHTFPCSLFLFVVYATFSKVDY